MNTRTITFVLVFICLLLVLAILLPYQYSDEVNIIDHIEKKETKINQEQKVIKQDRIDSLDRYSAIIEYPLFNYERSPLVVINDVPERLLPTKLKPPLSIKPEPLAASVIIPEALRLVGIMKVEDKGRAFVLGKGDLAVVNLEQGDHYQNWTITAIDTDKVVMSYNGKNVVVSINWSKKDLLQMKDNDSKQQRPIQGSSRLQPPFNQQQKSPAELLEHSEMN